MNDKEMTDIEELRKQIAELEKKLEIVIKYLQKGIEDQGYCEHMSEEAAAIMDEWREIGPRRGDLNY